MKQTFERNISFKRLAENNEYYKYIFKKTEKLVSVVFYILSHDSQKRADDQIKDDVLATAKTVHQRALDSLTYFEHAADEVLMQYAHALIALESTVRVAAAAGRFPADTVPVVVGEIEIVLRGINNRYLKRELPMNFLDTDYEPPVARSPRRTRTLRPSAPDAAPLVGGTAPDSATAESPAADTGNTRRARITTVLAARGESTIKDISDIITDVSEKTIQRELNAMIEDNMIRRIGERRWSKYVLN